MIIATRERPVLRELRRYLRNHISPRIRSMREFAESDVIIPDGPYKGMPYRCHRQPYSGQFFDLVDSAKFNRIFATGPQQSGKTLTCFVIPIMYHLCERRENVVVGVPTGDIIKNKWDIDLKPVFEAGKYRDLLPTSGAGSKGGAADTYKLRNGAVLKFMSAGGGDKKRSAFTSRVLVVTEVDGFDEVGGTSREADKFRQMEGRTRAYGERKMVYGECTVSTEEGRTWREFTHGTASRLILPCPHCGKWVTPERDHLVGWRDCETERDAKQEAAISCPECHQTWTERERETANSHCRVLHKGQEVSPTGDIVGPEPTTRTLGFRWNAVNNNFTTMGDVGGEEWNKEYLDDEDNAETALRQWVWAIPSQAMGGDANKLSQHEICRRISKTPKLTIPEGCKAVTVGVDVGKFQSWYTVHAWLPTARCVVVDHGSIAVPSDSMSTDQAIIAAMLQFHETISQDIGREPDAIGFDSGYETQAVYSLVTKLKKLKANAHAMKGFGSGQQNTAYNRPEKKTSRVKWIGEGCHGAYIKASKIELIEFDTDYWKSQVHDRLSCELTSDNTIQLFSAPWKEHVSFAKHVTAEEKIQQFDANRGTVDKWVKKRKDNHLLDCTSMGLVLGTMLGYTLNPISESLTRRKEAAKITKWF